MIGAVYNDIQSVSNFASNSLSKVRNAVSLVRDYVYDYFAKRHLIYGEYIEGTYSRNLFDRSVFQHTFPDKKVKEKKIIVKTISQEGTIFQFTVTMLTSQVGEKVKQKVKKHTILIFAENMAQGMSFISGHVDFCKQADEKELYNLTLLQVDSHSLMVKKRSDTVYKKWKPINAQNFGDIGYVIQGLWLRGHHINSFYFHSLGTTLFNGLDPSIIDHFAGARIIIDRGFVSTDETVWQQLPWYQALLITVGSHTMGWSVNINHALVKTLSHLHSSKKPRIIILEDQNDRHGFTYNTNLEANLSHYVESVERLKMIAEPTQVKTFDSEAHTDFYTLSLEHFHTMEGENVVQLLTEDVCSRKYNASFFGRFRIGISSLPAIW